MNFFEECEKIQAPPPDTFCKTCKYRERTQCGGRYIQYCGKRVSNRTENGKLKIKCKNEACCLYKPL